jgi:hypothetical protein
LYISVFKLASWDAVFTTPVVQYDINLSNVALFLLLFTLICLLKFLIII